MAEGGSYAIKSDVEKNLIEIWNGSTWNITSAPSADNSVMALNCVSSSWCVAVGFAGAQTRSETWNGSSWRTVPSADASNTLNNRLSGVSCTSSSWCVAVGYTSCCEATYSTITEQWNGKAWVLVDTPFGAAPEPVTPVGGPVGTDGYGGGDPSAPCNCQTGLGGAGPRRGPGEYRHGRLHPCPGRPPGAGRRAPVSIEPDLRRLRQLAQAQLAAGCRSARWGMAGGTTWA